jgi:hypothetical protein
MTVKHVTRTFPKTVLQDLLREDIETFEDLLIEVIEDRIFDNSRWSVISNLIFMHGEKFYQTTYSAGATENQYERPFEYEGPDIIVTEVEPVPITVIKYKPVVRQD